MEILLTIAFVAFLGMAAMVLHRVHALSCGVHSGEPGVSLQTRVRPIVVRAREEAVVWGRLAHDNALKFSHEASLWLAKRLYRFSQLIKGRRELNGGGTKPE